jgi:hypothetical protein
LNAEPLAQSAHLLGDFVRAFTKRVVEMRCRHIAAKFFQSEQERGRIRASGHGNQHAICWSDEAGLPDAFQHR